MFCVAAHARYELQVSSIALPCSASHSAWFLLQHSIRRYEPNSIQCRKTAVSPEAVVLRSEWNQWIDPEILHLDRLVSNDSSLPAHTRNNSTTINVVRSKSASIGIHKWTQENLSLGRSGLLAVQW
jgi:hypothetical protein